MPTVKNQKIKLIKTLENSGISLAFHVQINRESRDRDWPRKRWRKQLNAENEKLHTTCNCVCECVTWKSISFVYYATAVQSRRNVIIFSSSSDVSMRTNQYMQALSRIQAHTPMANICKLNDNNQYLPCVSFDSTCVIWLIQVVMLANGKIWTVRCENHL